MADEVKLRTKLVQIIHSHQADVLSCCFSGRILATTSGDKLVRMWSFDATKNARMISEEVAKMNPHSDFSEGYFSELPQSPLCAHSYAVNFCHFTPMGTLLATCSQDGKCIVWDVRTGRRLFFCEHPSKNSLRVCQFSPDSKLLATGSDDETVAFWDCSTRKMINSVAGHEASVVCLSFTPDSGYLATGATSGDIRIWDAKYGHGRHLLQVPEAHDLGVMTCQFSPSFGAQGATPEMGGSSMYMLASGGNDNLVKLWRVFVTVDAEVTVSVYTVLEGHTQNVMCVNFSPNGNYLASSAGDKLVILWDPIKGEELHRINHHERYVTCCAFSSDGLFLASGSNDKTVAIWKLYCGGENGKNLIEFEHEDTSDIHFQMIKGPKPVTSWTVEDVCSWLGTLDLAPHREVFRQNGIDGQELLHLSDKMLKESLEMDSLGNRNKILRGIKSLRDAFCAPRAHHHLTASLSFESPKRDLERPDEYYCPITHEMMRDPVIAADGYSYEREAITLWLESGKRTSPMTNAPLMHTDLTPNRSLKMLIQKKESLSN